MKKIISTMYLFLFLFFVYSNCSAVESIYSWTGNESGNTTSSTTTAPVTTTTIGEQCMVTIDPKAPSVPPGGTVQFFADTHCNGMKVFGAYTWEVHSASGSTVGSTIDANGLYRAGHQEGEDTVIVTDVQHGHIKDSAMVTVSQSVTTTTIPNDVTTTTTVGPDVTTTVAPGTTTTVDPDEESTCPINISVGAHSEKAELLRYFRDNVLSQTREGQEIIKLYYQLSPVIVKMMEEDEIFKEDMKEMINGVITLIDE